MWDHGTLEEDKTWLVPLLARSAHRASLKGTFQFASIQQAELASFTRLLLFECLSCSRPWPAMIDEHRCRTEHRKIAASPTKIRVGQGL
jgi:hypothetical protein